MTVEMLSALGFVVDARLAEKNATLKKPTIIKHLDNVALTATLWDGSEIKVPFKDLAHNWQVLAEVTQQRFDASACSEGSEDLTIELAKCRMKLALNSAFQERQDDLDAIEVQTQPRKGVFATKKTKAKEIKLVRERWSSRSSRQSRRGRLGWKRWPIIPSRARPCTG